MRKSQSNGNTRGPCPRNPALEHVSGCALAARRILPTPPPRESEGSGSREVQNSHRSTHTTGDCIALAHFARNCRLGLCFGARDGRADASCALRDYSAHVFLDEERRQGARVRDEVPDRLLVRRLDVRRVRSVPTERRDLALGSLGRGRRKLGVRAYNIPRASKNV